MILSRKLVVSIILSRKTIKTQNSKVTSGTIFDNIGCILFDWTVRRSFSISKIPDMINTSVAYGLQVCDLCIALIKNPEISSKLTSWIRNRKLEALKKQEQDLQIELHKVENQLSKEKNSISDKKKRNTLHQVSVLIPYVVSVAFSFGAIAHIWNSSMYNSNTEFRYLVILISVQIFIMMINLMAEKITFKRSDNIDGIRYDQRMKDLNSSLEIVQEQIENIKKEMDKGKN